MNLVILLRPCFALFGLKYVHLFNEIQWLPFMQEDRMAMALQSTLINLRPPCAIYTSGKICTSSISMSKSSRRSFCNP